MAKWIYTFNGAHLRELTNGKEVAENQIAILNALQAAYNDIIKNCPTLDEWDIERLEESRDLIEGDDEIVADYHKNPNSISDYGFDNATELVNARLAEFYDHCDYFRIWVSL